MKNLVRFIVAKLRACAFWLEKKYSLLDSRHKTLTSLAPKIITEGAELQKIKPYLDNLERAINTEGIENIAITGSYGSGKSTILKTFQYHHPNYKYLNISLASFKDNKDVEDEDFDRKLEISILQQIFYHVRPDKIPDSRFKRINNLTPARLALQTLFFIGWVISSLILFKFDYLNRLNPSTWDHKLKFDWFALLIFIIFLTGVGLFAKTIVRLFSNSKINKFNIKGEVELGDVDDKSVFNQHLDEILYYFEKTEFDVVVIEDIDRFNSTDIFTKLREINILINQCDVIRKKVTFIYAIKDEMFRDSAERVKFFEFIIPVIPFINPSNANEQLKKLIELANIPNTLSTSFTDDVITFIDEIDMRLLINIFQEFLVYKQALSKDLDPNELFAIILYKNMFPEDFALLSKRNGKLYTFISKKPLYIQSLTDDIKKQIDQLETDNKRLSNERSESVRELRAAYIGELVSTLARPYTINDIELDKLKDESNFNALVNIEGPIYYQMFSVPNYNNNFNVSRSNSGIKFSDIEKRLDSKNGFLSREKSIIAKAEGKIESNKGEIEQLKMKITEIESLSLQEIFEKVNIERFLDSFKDDYLIRSLLLNGYINENYNDYISVFHEVDLTQDDFAFERKVKSGIASISDFPLSHTENLIKRLPEKYFKRGAVLNYDLLVQLIVDRTKYPQKTANFFGLLSLDNNVVFYFVLGFVERKDKTLPVFIELLTTGRKDLCAYIIEKSDQSEKKIQELIRLVFEHAQYNAIKEQSEIAVLDNYIGGQKRIFDYSSQFSSLKNLIAFIKDQNIFFKELDTPRDKSLELFNFILEQGHYLVTVRNLEIICKQLDPQIDEILFNTANYTSLKKISNPHLLNHVHGNISAYVKDVLLDMPNNKSEDEASIIELLNYDEINIELKKSFLEMQEKVVDSLDSIRGQNVKELLFLKNKITPKWENIFYYIDHTELNGLDETLVGYLNLPENFSQLSSIKLNSFKEKSQEYITIFCEKLIHSSGLAFDAYTNLLKSVPYRYSSIDFSEIDKNRAEWMLDNRFLILTRLNFTNLKQHHANLHIKLLAVYENEFIEKHADYNLEANDWLLLFQSNLFSKDGKATMVGKIDDTLIISHPDIAEIVGPILSTSTHILPRFEVFDAIFVTNNTPETKIELLKLYEGQLDSGQIVRLTEKIGEDYAALFKEREKRTFSNQPFNIALFKILKERDLISGYKTNAQKNEIRVEPKNLPTGE